MPRCSCAGSTCGCKLQAGAGISVTGLGTQASPYIIAATIGDIASALNFSDSADVVFSAVGDGTPANPLVVSATTPRKNFPVYPSGGLPDPSVWGEGAYAYDSLLDAPVFSDGSAWNVAGVAKGARPKAAEWAFNAVRRGTANNTSAMTVGTLYCVPFYNPGPAFPYNRLGMNISVAGAAGALIRMGHYALGADGQIGKLLLDGGTVDATVTGDKTVTVAGVMPPGISLLVAVANDAAIRPRWIGSTPTVNTAWWRGTSGLTVNSDHSFRYTGYSAAAALPAVGTVAGEAMINTDALYIAARAA